ncbi:hypothetical protein LSCM4_07936 [Leishmania orientalis]|uniref:Peptidase S8/S53 domain-containing protein n=1 Tax=Leishmania orientalis TaxID=2249476 RepID=A0A836KR20_9TRYP|nr:hypothetical protein LSCM4_07936 [Leishmania orientalis]
MEALAGMRLFTLHLLAAALLVLLSPYAPEGQWPLTAQAALRFADAYADEPSVHPRGYYLGTYGARCIHHLTGVVTSKDAAERPACFSGRGVRVALLDTGLCAGITERSRNSVTCTSVVPGVACEDAGCAHGTRSLSVLAGHLAAQRSSERDSASTGQYLGLAPGATVRMFRVFDRHKRTRQRYLTRALDMLLREAEDGEAGRTHGVWNTSSWHVRRHDETVDVISLSYGSEDYYGNPQVQDRLYRLMHEYGVIVVAAAGNAGVRFGSVRSPADMPGVLAVGALRIEGHRASARTAQMSRTLGTCASCRSMAPHLSLNHSSPASVLGDFADSFAASSGDKSVAHFSGRGPTTWELPFGAGRVKPDLIALGQHVWTVQGVSAAAFSAVASRMRRASPALRLRSASGTSVAAPIVAGVVALCLEAAWSSPLAATSAQNITKDGALRDVRRSRLARVSNSLRVREAVLRTAIPLVDTAAFPSLSPHPTPATPARSNSSATAPDEHPRRVLAGVPLLQLYARYLHLSRVSILSQGAGEVQPLRALHAIVAGTPASSGFDALDPLRSCVSFAIPPSVRLGCGIPSGGGSSGIGVGIPQKCQSPHDPHPQAHGDSPLRHLPDVSLATQPAAYWWPFSEQLVYPGATPVLLNISLHLCPSSHSAAAGHCVHASAAPSVEAARLESTAPYTRVRYVLAKVSGYARAREACSSRRSDCHDGACPLPLFWSGMPSDGRERSTTSTRPLSSSARNTSSRASSAEGEAEGDQTMRIGRHHTRKAARPSAGRRSTPQRWMHRLLRVATELTVTASRSPTRSSVGEQQHQQLSPPPTSFSLSVAVSSPSSAHTRLCYDVARETVAMRQVRREKSQSSEKGAEVPEDRGSCAPLFHLFRALDVEGALHIFTVNSSQPTLTVPLSVRVVQPPPRAQRVLIDTSLDWFNPTTATSSLFIAGDDPHESAPSGATRRGQRQQRYERAYAEASGGDHPHTNLSLLWLYLHHTLGLAVGTFPLLHTSAIAASMAAGGNAALSPSATPTSNLPRSAQMASADALAQVGTLIIVDPELPLKRDMRRLLTRAVLSGGANHSRDGLNILLVTDWYSADIAAQLHWTRDESSDAECAFRCSGTDAAEAAVDIGGDGDAVRHLRAHRRLADGSTRGLKGSSHVPSWNRWLSEVTVASHSMDSGSDCSGAANRSSKGQSSAMPEAPFELSESIVIDGVVVVNATALAYESGPEGNATATRGGGGTITSAKAVAFRSLGHLNAAGVLQWRLPAQVTVPQQAGRVAAAGASKEVQEISVRSSGGGRRGTDCTSSAPTVPATLVGEAVMCNVVPDWAQQQRRLVKRTIISTSDGLSSASAKSDRAASGVEAAVVEDDWEDVPLENRGGRVVRIGGLEAAEMDTRASRETNASTATPQLTHGVLGLLTLSPPPTHVAAAPARRFRPGRIAIFTDSDCLSTSDYHAQGTLDELEGLLYPPSGSSSLPLATCATWDCFARSPGGQRLLQAESTQSSLCVEVVKELLLWGHTGNWHRWRDSARLHCEARTWAPAVHRSTANATPGRDTAVEDNARLVNADSGEEEPNFDDLLETAPERAHVGEVVWRLWAALAANTARDTESLVDGLEDRTRLQRGYSAEQEIAAAKIMRALMVSYHGDWRAHLEDSNKSSSSTSAADESYSPPPCTAGGRRSGYATTQSPAQDLSLLYRSRPLDDMLLTLRWIQHPIVLGQLMVATAVFLSVCLWRAWSSLCEGGRQRA